MIHGGDKQTVTISLFFYPCWNMQHFLFKEGFADLCIAVGPRDLSEDQTPTTLGAVRTLPQSTFSSPKNIQNQEVGEQGRDALRASDWPELIQQNWDHSQRSQSLSSF